MTPRKMRILFATFSYGGNGGIASQHPAVGDYLMHVARVCSKDPRIEGFSKADLADTPITMTRNAMCQTAIDGGADYLLMVDSDMHCDYGVESGKMKPFFETSFDFAYEHYDKGPVIVAAPYCGPPPEENVYCFQWTSKANSAFTDAVTGIAAESDCQLVQYTRPEAARMGGIHPAGAVATGLILIDVRILKMTDPMTDYKRLRKEGRTDEDACRAVRPWFYYEYKDCRETEKASTEDVTFSRDISLWGTQVLGYNPVFINWDAWAGHYKPHLVTKPFPMTADDVGFRMAMAARLGRRRDEAIQNLNIPLPIGFVPTPSGFVGHDADGSVTTWNPAVHATGLSARAERPLSGDSVGCVTVPHGRDSVWGADRAGEACVVPAEPGTGGGDGGPAPTLGEQLVRDQKAKSLAGVWHEAYGTTKLASGLFDNDDAS